MSSTWNEMIKHALLVKEHGKSYNIPAKELDAIVPKEFAESGVSSIDALNRVLAPHGLVGAMTLGSYVKVDVRPD